MWPHVLSNTTNSVVPPLLRNSLDNGLFFLSLYVIRTIFILIKLERLQYNLNLKLTGQGSRICTRSYTMDRFKENFYSQLKAIPSDLHCSKRSSLSSVLLNNDERKLTEEISHWMSHRHAHQECVDVFNFYDRFDSEEVEWRLNQALDIIDGRTCVHVEVIAQRVQELASLLKLGGNVNVLYVYKYLPSPTVSFIKVPPT